MLSPSTELTGSVNNVIEELKPVSKIIHSKHEREILEWLTVHEYAISHKDIFAKAESGTGQWFLNSQPFQTWLNNEKQSLLCCGNPGAGKTVITSLVVNHLLSKFQQSPDIGIAYIYCSYQRHTQQGATDILSSLLKQLTQTRSPLPGSVQDLYRVHEKFRTHPTYDQISEALFSVSREYSKVYIIIDALDECNASSNTRPILLGEMFRLQNHATANIFATSRPNMEVSSFFSGSLTQEIAATDDDIGRYLNRQILLNESLIIDDELRVEMNNKVVAAADGMYVTSSLIHNQPLTDIPTRFLLAWLQISTLLSQPTKGDLLEVLSSFNKGEQGLDEHYDQAMTRIQDQEPKRKALAMKILTWIVHSKIPLTMGELQHALAVRENSDELDENYIPRSEIILSLCAGLVIVDEESDVVRLVHYTTQEYFERQQKVWFEDAETEITIICGIYLSIRSDFERFDFPGGHWPLYDYARYHWRHHVRETPGRASEWLLRFAESKIKIPINNTISSSSGGLPTCVAGLHLAAYFDLRQTAAYLIESGSCADEYDVYGRTPLSYAADTGQEAIVNLLLAKGDVDPNSSPKVGAFKGMTPLIFASKNRHKAVVDLLLEVHDIDIDAQDSYGKTALFYAVISRNTSVVSKLLRKGANPNLKPTAETDRTPLSCATGFGDADIVKLLLDNGADLYLRGQLQNHNLPIFVAAKYGGAKVVKVLLAGGVDPEDVSEAGRTFLSFAAEAGNTIVAKLLLDTGKVDPNSKCSNGRTPLSYAAGRGHEAVVELMLGTCKANPNSKCRNGRTPLFYATEGGHEAVVELLLGTCRVDPNSRAEDLAGMTSLGFACLREQLAIVKILLNDDRVDPDSKLSQDEMGGPTELFRAAWRGQEAIVRLLLDTGKVDVNLRHTNGWTPLDYAKTKNIRRMLRERGAKHGRDL